MRNNWCTTKCSDLSFNGGHIEQSDYVQNIRLKNKKTFSTKEDSRKVFQRWQKNMTRMTLDQSFSAKLTSWRTIAAGNEVADMLNTTIDGEIRSRESISRRCWLRWRIWVDKPENWIKNIIYDMSLCFARNLCAAAKFMQVLEILKKIFK